MREPLFFRQYGYDPARVPNAWLAEKDAGVSNITQAEARTGKTIGYPGWLLLYSLLLSHFRPDGENIIVETGTNVGCSSIMLAQALKDAGVNGKVHTIEIDPQTAEKAKNNFRDAGVSDYIQQYVGDAKAELQKLLPSLPRLRAAFLDGSHDEPDVMREFELVEPRLDDGALVFFDNTYEIAEAGEDRRVNGALREIKKRYGGNIINLEFVSWYTPGFAIWQRDAFTLNGIVQL
ncbi:O-methyltransferase [Hyphococcus sp.]|jgi:predicted O-methyltransferase YrrM|uniref:O-methyltransferase n=1 Tax=Hyphococcus sp. TaxID=2038636 RepID=UPI003D107AF1